MFWKASRLISGEQLSGCSGGWHLARDHLLREFRQQGFDTGLTSEVLFQACINALPHPRLGLPLPALLKLLLGLLQTFEFQNAVPKAVDALV